MVGIPSAHSMSEKKKKEEVEAAGEEEEVERESGRVDIDEAVTLIRVRLLSTFPPSPVNSQLALSTLPLPVYTRRLRVTPKGPTPFVVAPRVRFYWPFVPTRRVHDDVVDVDLGREHSHIVLGIVIRREW